MKEHLHWQWFQLNRWDGHETILSFNGNSYVVKQIKGYGNLLKIQKFFQQNPEQNFWKLAAMRLALKNRDQYIPIFKS